MKIENQMRTKNGKRVSLKDLAKLWVWKRLLGDVSDFFESLGWDEDRMEEIGLTEEVREEAYPVIREFLWEIMRKAKITDEDGFTGEPFEFLEWNHNKSDWVRYKKTGKLMRRDHYTGGSIFSSPQSCRFHTRGKWVTPSRTTTHDGETGKEIESFKGGERFVHSILPFEFDCVAEQCPSSNHGGCGKVYTPDEIEPHPGPATPKGFKHRVITPPISSFRVEKAPND